LAGEFGAQASNDVGPALAALESPTHAGFCLVAAPVAEYCGVTAGGIVEFLVHPLPTVY